MGAKAVMAVLHKAEPTYADELRKEILAAIGNIDHIEVWGQEVLVAAYVTSPYYGERRPGFKRILKGENEQTEDKWQAKSFLVLKLGDGVEAACKKSGRQVPRIGGWYYGNVQEHWQLSVRGIDAKGAHDEDDSSKYIRPWGNAGWPCRQVLLADIRGSCGGRPQDIV